MDIFLDALKKSVQHLQTIDKIFSRMDHPNKKEYRKIKRRILKLNSNDPDLKFTDSLYVGGKSGSGLTGYGRQMILSDIIQYIFLEEDTCTLSNLETKNPKMANSGLKEEKHSLNYCYKLLIY